MLGLTHSIKMNALRGEDTVQHSLASRRSGLTVICISVNRDGQSSPTPPGQEGRRPGVAACPEYWFWDPKIPKQAILAKLVQRPCTVVPAMSKSSYGRLVVVQCNLGSAGKPYGRLRHYRSFNCHRHLSYRAPGAIRGHKEIVLGNLPFSRQPLLCENQ